MSDLTCDICGDAHKDKFMITLNCNHSFHYECVMKSFQCDKKASGNNCPLCRQTHGLLPVVNGLPKLIRGIHYINAMPQHTQVRCCELLKSGKRKGLPCGCKCMIGMNVCKRHHVSNLKQQEKQLKITKLGKVGLGDALEQVQLEQMLDVTAAMVQ